MDSKRILVIGSLNMDLVTRVKVTPRVGETVHGMGLEQIPGGKGANQATAMAKLGAPVRMAGCVGSDAYGQVLKAKLKEAGIEDAVTVSNTAPTGTALIMVNATADNSIVVISGANGELVPERIEEAWFEGIDFLVMQLEVPLSTVETALAMAKAKGIMTVLNPAPAMDLPEHLLKKVDLLVVNETEFETYAGFPYRHEQDLAKGYERISAKAILLTLGSEGSWYFSGNASCFVPALKVDAVDTTAAGDSYIGGLLYELSAGKTIEEAMDFATRVAAYTVTQFGAQSSLPTLENLRDGGFL